MIRIYGNFNAIERKQFIRLGTTETSAEIRRLGSRLREGLNVILDDGSFEAEGSLELAPNGVWRARLIPGTGRDK